MIVCVTGAAGQIAYSFIPQLLKGNVFGNRSIHLKMLDITPALKILEGVILEINDCTYSLLHKVTFLLFRSNMEIMLNKCLKDVISLFSLEVFPESQECKEKTYYKKTKIFSLCNQKH